MQLSIPFPSAGSQALITETIIAPAKSGVVSIVLDVDVFREYPSPLDDGEVWPCLEKLRKIKNEIFEACITDKTRGLFQ